MQTYVHGEHDQIHHGGRDSLSRPLKAGTQYRLFQPGQKSLDVTIHEDPSTCDLYFTVKGRRESAQRIEECSIDCVFSELLGDGQVDEVLWQSIADQMLRAQLARQELTMAEQTICGLLNCSVGDMSDASDAVTAAVRDGLGSAFDLAQLAS